MEQGFIIRTFVIIEFINARTMSNISALPVMTKNGTSKQSVRDNVPPKLSNKRYSCCPDLTSKILTNITGDNGAYEANRAARKARYYA